MSHTLVKKYSDPKLNSLTWPENILKIVLRPRTGFGPVRGNSGFRVAPQVFSVKSRLEVLWIFLKTCRLQAWPVLHHVILVENVNVTPATATKIIWQICDAIKQSEFEVGTNSFSFVLIDCIHHLQSYILQQTSLKFDQFFSKDTSSWRVEKKKKKKKEQRNYLLCLTIHLKIRVPTHFVWPHHI